MVQPQKILARSSWALLATCTAALLGAAGPSWACLELPAHPPDVSVVGDACTDGEITVRIHDYSTFAASADFCACALNIPLAFGQVISADIIDTATGVPISEFNFSADPDSNFGGTSDWQGFSSSVASIPAGSSVDLWFRVIPVGDLPCDELASRTANALRNPVGPGAIGTAGADEDGVPIHHIGITAAGTVSVENPGAEILNQPPDESCAVISDAQSEQVLAESFVVDAATAVWVRQVSFTGAYLFSNQPAPVDRFEVNFYTDNGGQPAPVPLPGCSHLGIVPTSRFATGRDLNGTFDLYEFTLDLYGGCALATGASYWVEIFETTSGTDAFALECGLLDPDHGLQGSAVASEAPGVIWQPLETEFSLRIVAGSASPYGLPHTAIGAAILGQNQLGQLVVSNLGSSGKDGVRVSLGAAEYHLVGLDPLSGSPDLPDGASVEITTEGELDGEPDQSIWSVRFEDQGEEFSLSLDATAVQPGALRLEARLDGVVVDTVLLNPAPANALDLLRLAPEGCFVDPFWRMDDECWILVALENPVPITLTGSSTVLADEVVIASIDQVGVVGSLSATQILAADVPEITLFEEKLGMFDLPHRILGQATFEAQGDRLTISNLGSSGEDGVAVDLDAAEYFLMRFEGIELVQEEAAIRLSAAGAFGGEPDAHLGEAVLTRVGGDLVIETDYSSLGASSVRIEVYDDGELVGTTTVPSGPVGTIVGGRVWDVGKDPDDDPCFVVVFAEDVELVASDSTVLVGDEVLLLAADAAGPVAGLSEFSLRVQGVDSVSIVSETTTLNAPSPLIFSDGFESGDTSVWSAVSP